MNRRVDELVNGAARSQQPYDDTHKVLPAAPATLAERYGEMPKVDIAPEDAQRLYDAVGSGLLVPAPIPERVAMPSSMLNIRTADGSDLPTSARITEETAVDREAIADADRFVTKGDAPGRPSGGIMAQASALLAKAADDPRLAGLIAQGLEMALDERRLTARYPRETVDAAQALQAVLEKRGNER